MIKNTVRVANASPLKREVNDLPVGTIFETSTSGNVFIKGTNDVTSLMDGSSLSNQIARNWEVRRTFDSVTVGRE